MKNELEAIVVEFLFFLGNRVKVGTLRKRVIEKRVDLGILRGLSKWVILDLL